MTWLGLILIMLLACLCVISGFIGMDKSQLLFNSIPLGVYFFIFTVILLTGIISIARSLRKGGLLLIHCGCVLILLGGMWGSQAAHDIRTRLFNDRKIPSGYMVIYEGGTENEVFSTNFERNLGGLGFSIFLEDFWIEYYTDLANNVRDYKSSITVLKEGKTVKQKVIEVNHPLYFGGYHFYQHSYDTHAGEYTILSVVSDSGLYSVYIGYLLLCVGMFRHFWSGKGKVKR